MKTSFGTNLILGIAALTMGGLAVASTEATARGKDVYIQDYDFKKPNHGYSGHSGNYYCDYQRIPKRKCTYVNGVEKCKVVGWTLRQMCQ